MRCVWYRIRGLVLLFALMVNLKKDFFCRYLCPFGSSQVLLAKIPAKRIRLPSALGNLKYLGLALLLVIVTSIGVPAGTPGLFSYHALGLAMIKIKVWLFGIFVFAFVLSLFNFRFFCFHLCPVKALDLSFLKRKFKADAYR
ncbi:4Fe-4S binding protein [Candidatus Omnitrophota bacterium]